MRCEAWDSKTFASSTSRTTSVPTGSIKATRRPKGTDTHLILAAALAIGAPAPDFSLPDLQGHTLTLAGYRGKVVLLDFWATWCAPCREETPRLVALQEKYRRQRFQILGISLDDDAAPVRAFHRQMKMNYPVAVGNAALAERYGGILGMPVAFLIDCHGRIRARWDGEIDAAAVDRAVAAQLRDCGQK